MKFPASIIILFFLLSCAKQENTSGINNDLYKEIIKYQKENPIDKSDSQFLSDGHFIYEVVILPPKYSNPEDKNYSLFITMSVFGIRDDLKKLCYGVYQDEFLQKTVIYDEANFIDRFVTVKKKENIETYILKNSPIIDIVYPVRLYNIVDGKLLFIDEIKGNNHRK
ncbi:hypothetical protein LUD75_15760 [Epilithonimonas sp. JDS]|uniref:hypothetical protein n=1 Tax=Epilithonimonas sp. JDS TaxID=2902797 RepID=UPI001E3EABEF|nr:hypothetical protein [Epilithonimonas sp. JDS]MCD9856182.1 hypothetical protein [Epilithonimonas sp. JDS]